MSAGGESQRHRSENALSLPGTDPSPTDNQSEKDPNAGSDPTQFVQGLSPTASNTTPCQSSTSSKRGTFMQVLIFSAFVISLFANNFDRVIVATAMPVMASKFNALDQASWIATSFLLTQSTCQIAWGQILAIVSQKWTYFCAVVIFLVGNLLAALAWDLPSLLGGRAISGLGGAGMMISLTVLTTSLTKLEHRPMVFGLFGIVVAIANIIGPLVGGALVDHISWRWCFYIMLPLGAVNAILIVLCFPATSTVAAPGPVSPINAKNGKYALTNNLWKFDWIGNSLAVAMNFALVFCLQGGGVLMSWSDKRIGILFGLAGVFLILFVLWERRLEPARAALPTVLFSRRTTIGIAFQAFFVFFMSTIGHFFLPLFYQASRERNPVQAGIDILPYLVGIVAGTMTAATIVKRTGRPWPFMFCCPLVTALISGFLFWVMRASPPRLNVAMVLIQLIYGLSAGLVVQHSFIYIQAEYRDEPGLIPQATAMTNTSQLVGGLVGAAIGGAILNSRLPISLKRNAPDLPEDMVSAVMTSVSAILHLDTAWKEPVKRAYGEALAYVFLPNIPAGIIASGSALIMKKHNLKQQ